MSFKAPLTLSGLLLVTLIAHSVQASDARRASPTRLQAPTLKLNLEAKRPAILNPADLRVKATEPRASALEPATLRVGPGGSGGAGKPAASFGHENMTAILNSDKISDIMGLNFSIESIVLKSVDERGYLYAVTAKTAGGQNSCLISATVWNTHQATIDQVMVRAAKIISGCTIAPEPVSVIETYKSTFALFPGSLSESDGTYEEYLKIARSIDPKIRKAIREHMKVSEPRFFEVYSKNAQSMAKTVNTFRGMSIDGAMGMLAQVMGFPPHTEGIIMPVIVGLKFAPFFIVDADQL